MGRPCWIGLRMSGALFRSITLVPMPVSQGIPGLAHSDSDSSLAVPAQDNSGVVQRIHRFMKLYQLLALARVSVFAFSAFAADGAKSKKKDKEKLRHVVAFKFKETATPADIERVQAAFKALKGKIPQITKLEAGLNNSPEKHNKGCTHVWILTFGSEKDRDDYLVHPAHKEFGALVGPFLGDVFVVDFWATE